MPQLSRLEVANLATAFADALKRMSDEDFSLLLAGEGKLQLVRRIQPKTSKLRAQESDFDLSSFAERLRSAPTRDEALAVLRELPKGTRKNNLTGIAKLFQVHVTKEDTINRIEDKLVETVVGAGIRSKAIQSLPL